MSSSKSTSGKASELEPDLSIDDGEAVVYSPYLPADFQHWALVAYWSPLEAACLSLGYGPMLIANSSLEQLQSEPDCYDKVVKRYQITSRAVEVGIIKQHTSPHNWTSWFTTKALAIPDHLAECVLATPNLEAFGLHLIPNGKAETMLEQIDSIHAAVSGDPSNLHNPSSNTKEMTSLEKMVITMAVSGYGHDPLSNRSSTAKEIADDAAKNGISMSVDTARKFLKRAAELHLPQ